MVVEEEDNTENLALLFLNTLFHIPSTELYGSSGSGGLGALVFSAPSDLDRFRPEDVKDLPGRYEVDEFWQGERAWRIYRSLMKDPRKESYENAKEIFLSGSRIVEFEGETLGYFYIHGLPGADILSCSKDGSSFPGPVQCVGSSSNLSDSELVLSGLAKDYLAHLAWGNGSYRLMTEPELQSLVEKMVNDINGVKGTEEYFPDSLAKRVFEGSPVEPQVCELIELALGEELDSQVLETYMEVIPATISLVRAEDYKGAAGQLALLKN